MVVLRAITILMVQKYHQLPSRNWKLTCSMLLQTTRDLPEDLPSCARIDLGLTRLAIKNNAALVESLVTSTRHATHLPLNFDSKTITTGRLLGPEPFLVLILINLSKKNNYLFVVRSSNPSSHEEVN